MKGIRMAALTAAALLSAAMLFGCSGGKDPETSGGDSAALSGQITVLSREEGSGTRGAFIELFGIEVKDADGNKVDQTVKTAEIVNSTSAMSASVAGNKKAIGYVSLGALSKEVKALKIDGVAPSAAGVKDGSYKVSRPFHVATKGDATGLAADFLAYVKSPDGQKVVEDKGYISEGAGDAYTASNQPGTLKISGSTSVYPVMEKLVEAYKVLNPDVDIKLQQSDSTTGLNDVKNGISDIGMASRDLKDSEKEAGLVPQVIALDGIAVIVNRSNPLDGLTAEQVQKIYTAAVTDWSELN